MLRKIGFWKYVIILLVAIGFIIFTIWDAMPRTVEFWLPVGISIGAIILSIYTIWDTAFRSKVEISCGKQSQLNVMKLDNQVMQPIILMSIAFINSGGKTAYLNDVKIKVKISSNGTDYLEEDFSPIREYDNVLTPNSFIQTEILPIVIVGRTSIVKKYIFYPATLVTQGNIPANFNLNITVSTNQNSNWTIQKEYVCTNIDNVWQDLNSTNGTFNYSLRDLSEKN